MISRCLLGLVLIGVLITLGCEIPNLDPPECSASRTTVREFYSFHFGNEMKVSREGIEARNKFITPELAKLALQAPENTDPFTTGDADIPKAFRAGKCSVVDANHTVYDVLLFWKDDVRSEQRSIKVHTEKVDDNWLISRIER